MAKVAKTLKVPPVKAEAIMARALRHGQQAIKRKANKPKGR